MKENTHTPAPWTKIELGHTKKYFQIEGREGQWVADVKATVNPESAEANARLIAACPDLLEACKDTLRILNLNPTYDNQYQRDKLTHLIQKATGN